MAAFILTAAPQHIAAQQLLCSTILPGDTAAHLAQRVTGDARNRHAPWFQILDPSMPRFIAKAQYDLIHPGWRACVVNGAVTRTARGIRAEPPAPTETLLAGIARVIDGAADLTAALWVAVAMLIAFVWHSIDTYVSRRKVTVAVMQKFGERFVREFERPLLQPCVSERPIRSLLRANPERGRLDILLAPNSGRRYPNLADHRTNVVYDVARVLQVLRDQSFACGPLYAQESWVVVPFQLDEMIAKQAGGR